VTPLRRTLLAVALLAALGAALLLWMAHEMQKAADAHRPAPESR